jgi:zinc protease
MRRSLWILIALQLPVFAAEIAAPQIPVTRYELKNGLTVILSEDHRLPLVSVNLWYRASPANEPPHRSGFAHLFEHMMFKGSAHVGDGQHIKLLEAAGVTLWNGTTDFDRTNYFETLPANRLELALWLESDRMGFLADALTAAKLDNQREVVRNERRQSFENTPYASSEEALVQALFPAGHPYHGNVIGSHEDLAAAAVADVAAFHRAFYAPANATLAIVGDFRAPAAQALIEKYFGPLPGGARQPDRGGPPPRPAARRLTREDAVTLPRVFVGWVTPPAFAAGDAELDLAARLLGANRSSRLFQRLIHQREVASDVHCQHQPLALGSIFECWATAAPGKSAAEVERALTEELEAVRKTRVAPAEIERARNGLFAQAIQQLEQLGGFGGKSDVLQYYAHYKDDPGWLGKDFDRYRSVTAAELQAAIVAHLPEAHRITVTTLPKPERRP